MIFIFNDVILCEEYVNSGKTIRHCMHEREDERFMNRKLKHIAAFALAAALVFGAGGAVSGAETVRQQAVCEKAEGISAGQDANVLKARH